MRGSIVVLTLAGVLFAAPVSSAQTTTPPTNPGDQKCKVRPRATPASENGVMNRADPAAEGNKNCAPVTVGVTSVSGVVYFDVNKDGMFEPDDESALVSWTVQLTGPVTLRTTTDANGAYSFGGLAPGEYTLCVLPPMFWQQITPTSGPVCGTDFGYTITAPTSTVNT